MEAYQNAIRLDNTRTESYYNLGQAYLLNLLLNEAESEFRRAKEMRPQLISFYTSISSRHPNRLTIDRIIEPIHLWKRLLGETPERERRQKDFGHFWASGTLCPSKKFMGRSFSCCWDWSIGGGAGNL